MKAIELDRLDPMANEIRQLTANYKTCKLQRGIIYLAGSIDGQKYSKIMRVRNKAKKLLERCSFKVLCPMRGRENLRKTPIMTRYNIEKVSNVYKNWGFIDRDLMDLKNSDCLLILTGDTPTDGTYLEYGYALWKLDIPIVMIAPTRIGGHGWSNRYASYIAKDLEDAVHFIDNFLFYE